MISLHCLRLPQKLLKSFITKHPVAMSSPSEFHVSATDPETQFHEVKDESTGAVRKVAYLKTSGPRTPGIIYIPGFMSPKSGIKAVSLHKFCQKYGFPYVRYDPAGLGETEGIHLKDALFSKWVQDAEEILLHVTEGPQLVVGSSMGGWISCLLAQKHPEKFEKLLMIAPAVNFHHQYLKLLRSQLDEKSLKRYEEGDVVPLYQPDYGSFPLRKAQFEDMGRKELSLEKGGIDVTCPVRILHGIQDKDVPYKSSLAILNALKSTDVRLLYLKDGDHRLASEPKLELLFDTILDMTSSKASSSL